MPSAARRRPAADAITRDVVVIGASAGGVQALRTLLAGLPSELPASVLVVVHISPTAESILPRILSQAGPLSCRHPRQDERLEHARIYVAPPDHHVLVKPHELLSLDRGPRENRFRPAIDALFRSAARACGSRVIGIVLTGGLADGTLGLAHIKHHGGLALVQDPEEAVFPSMPRSAIRHVVVDHVVPVAAMPALLNRLVREPMSEEARTMADPSDQHPDTAESGDARLRKRTASSPPNDIICPDCGGPLWEFTEHNLVHYQCHVGHSFTAEALLEGKTSELESALWGALRALEESAELRRRLAARLSNAPYPLQDLQRRYQRQAEQAEWRAALLRSLLTNGAEAERLAADTEAEALASAADESIAGNGDHGRGSAHR